MAVCPRCGSSNISYQMIQTDAVTDTRNKGCLYGIGRMILVICTCGLWLLIGSKKSKSRTRYHYTKTAICQNCGHHWNA